MPPGDALDLEAILSRDQWLERLARGLVPSEFDADDVRQETWLSALRSASVRPGRSLLRHLSRGWMVRVASNLVRREHRTTRRRLRRERVVARPEGSPREIRPGAALERAELRRQVVEAVTDLREPYRSTIVLRFFEDLTLEDVARSQGVPLNTVKTRVARGLSLLRARLDRLHGRRGSWVFILEPLLPDGLLAGPAGAAAAPSGAAAASLFEKAGVVMSMKGLVSAGVVSVAAMVGLGIALHRSLDGSRPEPDPRSTEPGGPLAGLADPPVLSPDPGSPASAGSPGLSHRDRSRAPGTSGTGETGRAAGAVSDGEPGAEPEPEPDASAPDADELASEETLALRRTYSTLKGSFGEGGRGGWKAVGENMASLEELLLGSDEGFEELLALIDEEDDAAFLEALMHHLPMAKTEWRRAILEDRELHEEIWARFEEEESPGRRMALLRFFAFNRQLSGARMGSFLQAATDDPSEAVRQLSVDAIASNRDLIDETWPTLARVFETDPSPECRRTAVLGLGQVRDPRAAELVDRAFSSPDESMRAAAVRSDAGKNLPESLTGGDPVGYLVDEFRGAETRAYKEALLERLHERSPDTLEEEIRQALPREKDWSIRKEYRNVLERIADARKARGQG